MKKEKTDFEEYDSGFFYGRFNRLLKLIRKNRVLPIRPGWEQTPDGIVPPPIYSSSANGLRPFQVVNTTAPADPDSEEDPDLTVSVNTGRFAFFGSAAWGQPTWTTGDFNTDTTIENTKFLWLHVSLDVSRLSGSLPAVVSSSIGWYDFDSEPDAEVLEESVEIDIVGETVTTSYSPEDNYSTRILLASVQVDGTGITGITQYVDYNILIPGNVNRFLSVEASE